MPAGAGEVDEAIDAKTGREVVADGDVEVADTGDRAGVLPLKGVGSGIDGGDNLKLRVVVGERNHALPHPPARPVNRDVNVHVVFRVLPG